MRKQKDTVLRAIYISLKSSVCQQHYSPSPGQMTAGKRQWVSKLEKDQWFRIRTNRGQEGRHATGTLKLQDKAPSHLLPVVLALPLLAWTSVATSSSSAERESPD